MKRNLIHFLLLFLFSLSACIPSGKLSEVVAYESGRPYTRWWWFASELDTLDVKYQLEWLKEQGFGGVEIAWIYPMHGDSTVKRVDWLSTEWSEAVAYAKRIADALGLGCDFTYGTLWPFNEVGLPDEDGSRGFYDSISPVNRTLTWEHPKKARILNHLDKEAFYRYASKMNSGLKDAYQGSKSGVFVDSWEVETRHMWTKGFGDKFKKRFGYAIEPFMDKLYQIGYEDVYYDYMSLISDYVLYEFYQPFTENANSQGAFSRSQCGGAPADLLSAFMLVDVPETEAILYEPNFGRIPASAAALTGKPIVSSETFTCLYGWNPWGGKGPYQGQEQVADMRLIADALFANGVNQIIWHGMPYNKKDDYSNYFYASVHVGPNAFFKNQLKDFNQYMTTVSNYMKKGKVYSDVALYLPLEDSWMGVEYPDSLQMPWVWGEYELRYVWAPDYLKGYQPLWVNNKVLTESCIVNNRMLYGEHDFSALVIDVEYLDLLSLRQVVRLAESGLPILMPRTPKQPGKNKSTEYTELLTKLLALSNVSSVPTQILCESPLLEGQDLPEFWCRQDGRDLYIFFANPAAKKLKYPLRYKQAFEDQGSVCPITIYTPVGPKPYTLNFAPNQSLLLKIKADGTIENVDISFEAKEI